MEESSRAVLEGLRTKLGVPKGARAFIDDLSDRVRQLVAAGFLVWGNAAKSFVTLTPAGRELREAAHAGGYDA